MLPLYQILKLKFVFCQIIGGWPAICNSPILDANKKISGDAHDSYFRFQPIFAGLFSYQNLSHGMVKEFLNENVFILQSYENMSTFQI